MADEDDFDFDEMMEAFDAGAEVLAAEHPGTKIDPSWLPNKVKELHGAQALDAATVVVLDQQALDAHAESMMGPWVAGEHFKADLKMSKLVWFYHNETKKRCLLAHYAPTKDDGAGEMRALGKQAATQLQGRKIRVADFVFASSIAGLADLVGHFENSFHAGNFEKSYKRPKP